MDFQSKLTLLIVGVVASFFTAGGLMTVGTPLVMHYVMGGVLLLFGVACLFLILKLFYDML